VTKRRGSIAARRIASRIVFLANLGRCFQAAGLFDRKAEYGVADLMRALSAAGPAALLIDEYENASSEGSDNILETIIRTLPASCHLFVATRELPKIALAKMLVDGRTRVVDAGDLRFSDEETCSIVADSRLPESYSDLLQQSEGWPVMVQLARLDWQNSGGQLASAVPRLGPPDTDFRISRRTDINQDGTCPT